MDNFDRIALGIKGEKMAQKYLKQHKYKILDTNYRCSIGEIDIVAKKGDYIVFVEVKARKSAKFGLPCEAVDERKQHKLQMLAMYYLRAKRLLDAPVSFAVVEVLGDEIRLIEDAF